MFGMGPALTFLFLTIGVCAVVFVLAGILMEVSKMRVAHWNAKAEIAKAEAIRLQAPERDRREQI